MGKIVAHGLCTLLSTASGNGAERLSNVIVPRCGARCLGNSGEGGAQPVVMMRGFLSPALDEARLDERRVVARCGRVAAPLVRRGTGIMLALQTTIVTVLITAIIVAIIRVLRRMSAIIVAIIRVLRRMSAVR
jgi:hypothetical protein